MWIDPLLRPILLAASVRRMKFLKLFRNRKSAVEQPLRSLPWLTDRSIDALERFIASAERPVRALELGAGASTVWLASRVHSLLSVEHNEQWADRVRSELGARGLGADIRTLPRPYYALLDSLEDQSFDLILIDGRDRVECLRRARRLLSRSGLLLIDNTERIGSAEKPGRYYEMLELLSGWSCMTYWQDGPDRTGWDAKKPWSTMSCRRDA